MFQDKICWVCNQIRTMRNQLGGGRREESERLKIRWGETEREKTGSHSNTNLFHFSRHGPKSPPSLPKRQKPPGKMCGNYFLHSEKFSFPSSPPGVSSRFPGLFARSFPSVSAEAAVQTQAAILWLCVKSDGVRWRYTGSVLAGLSK